MKVLIVHISPEAQSFGSALKDLAVETLGSEGHSVEVSDLYAMNFNPVASTADFSTRLNASYLNYMLEQRNAAEKGLFAADIEQEMAKVKQADFLILNFPLWWFSSPAMLKGWIDRVFATGFAWNFGAMYAKGLLRGKRAMLVVTTGGPAEVYREDSVHGKTLEQILFPISHGALHFCGYEVLPTFTAWSTFQAGDEGRQQYLEEYKKRLLKLEQTPAMKDHTFA